MTGRQDSEWTRLLRQAEVLAWTGVVVLAVALVQMVRLGQISAAVGVATGWAMTLWSARQLRRLRIRDERRDGPTP